jgi:chorismate dehydratase
MTYNTVAVSYLNTKPLLYGIFHAGLETELQISLQIPSVCAAQLTSGEAQIGLVPVGALPDIPNAQIITDYCIGAVGEVKTVCIYAERPLHELTHLHLDYHSRTSVLLAQVLLKEFWQHDLTILPAQKNELPPIGGTTGAVLIGDKTFGLEQQYPYIYDLAAAWFEHTGLPFVFAVWVAIIPLDAAFIQRLNIALAEGIAHIPQLCQLIPPPENATFSLEEYYTKYISYNLNDQKRAAIALFLQKIAAL